MVVEIEQIDDIMEETKFGYNITLKFFNTRKERSSYLPLVNLTKEEIDNELEFWHDSLTDDIEVLIQ